MSTFLEWLEATNERDTKVRAVLRRSLAFDPGTFPAAFPYVEPFLNDTDSIWRREVFYLVAGLWAMHWRRGRQDTALRLGLACRLFDSLKKSGTSHEDNNKVSSTESRFIALLDSDSEQLPHRLRQMIALLTEQSIDFGALLDDLLYWQSEHKRTQNAWARDFYRHSQPHPDIQQTSDTQEEAI